MRRLAARFLFDAPFRPRQKPTPGDSDVLLPSVMLKGMGFDTLARTLPHRPLRGAHPLDSHPPLPADA